MRTENFAAQADLYTYAQLFMALFPGLPRCVGARRNFLLGFMVQGKITEADTPTIQLGATASGLICNPPPSSPIFALDAIPAATLPLYPGLGQAPNMLACIPSGVVRLVCIMAVRWLCVCVSS